MTYYISNNRGPLVFSTQPAKKVEEWMIPAMLELLLKREYETYSPKDAADNIQSILNMDEVFEAVPEPPRQEPRQADVQWWVSQFLQTQAGRNLLNQVGAPLQEQNNSDLNPEEITLSDLLPQLAIPSEWDSEGPNLHSQMTNQPQ